MNVFSRTPNVKTRIVVALAIVTAVVTSAALLHKPSKHHNSRTTNVSRRSAPTTKQRAAADFDFPLSSGRSPQSLTSRYDNAKDRTRMTLDLLGVNAIGPSGVRVSNAGLTLVSEFSGKTRPAGIGELSVQCVLEITSSTPGVLAPSEPLVTFTADGSTIIARSPSKGTTAYKSKSSSGGAYETVSFRIGTRDLIKIAKSPSVSAKCGMVNLSLTPSQLTDLKEFTARMDPSP